MSSIELRIEKSLSSTLHKSSMAEKSNM